MKDKFIDFYMNVAQSTAELSTCNRKKVGAVIIDKSGENIISYGYNGTPRGLSNCCEDTLEDGSKQTKSNVIHAEVNAITKLSKNAESSEDGYLFLTLSPCENCAGLIIQSGIKTVYYKEQYRCDGGIKMLEESNIEVFQLCTLN